MKTTEQLRTELKMIENVTRWLTELEGKFSAEEVVNFLYYDLYEESNARRLAIAERQLEIDPNDVLARFVVKELEHRF